MEIQEIVTHQFLDKIGWYEAPSAVERLRVEEPIVVGLAPHEEIVATLYGQFSLGVLVWRVLKGLVAEASNVDVASTLSRNVKHVYLTLSQNALVGQSIEGVC